MKKFEIAPGQGTVDMQNKRKSMRVQSIKYIGVVSPICVILGFQTDESTLDVER